MISEYNYHKVYFNTLYGLNSQLFAIFLLKRALKCTKLI